MKIFLTGASGFVGKAVAQSLIESGHDIRGLIRNDKDRVELSDLGITTIIGDLSNHDLLHRESTTADAVFHGAAANTPAWNEANELAIDVIFRALQGTNKPFIMQSGAMIFGDTGQEPVMDASASFNPPQPLKSRMELEKYVLDGLGRKVRSSIVYASYVYGGAGAVIPAIMKNAAVERGVSFYPYDGLNKWATVHYQDWANLMKIALTSSEARGIYVASGEILTLKSIATSIAHQGNFNTASFDPQTDSELWSMFTMPLSYFNQSFLGDRARAELGWIPLRTMNENI